jgi:hypothetical protein
LALPGSHRTAANSSRPGMCVIRRIAAYTNYVTRQDGSMPENLFTPSRAHTVASPYPLRRYPCDDFGGNLLSCCDLPTTTTKQHPDRHSVNLSQTRRLRVHFGPNRPIFRPFALSTPDAHRRYTGGTPDAQGIFRCTSGVHPVYLRCTRAGSLSGPADLPKVYGFLPFAMAVTHCGHSTYETRCVIGRGARIGGRNTARHGLAGAWSSMRDRPACCGTDTPQCPVCGHGECLGLAYVLRHLHHVSDLLGFTKNR